MKLLVPKRTASIDEKTPVYGQKGYVDKGVWLPLDMSISYRVRNDYNRLLVEFSTSKYRRQKRFLNFTHFCDFMYNVRKGYESSCKLNVPYAEWIRINICA